MLHAIYIVETRTEYDMFCYLYIFNTDKKKFFQVLSVRGWDFLKIFLRNGIIKKMLGGIIS